MSVVNRENAETRQTMAIIHAMTKNGPTRWAGNPPIEPKDEKPRHKSRHNEKETKNND